MLKRLLSMRCPTTLNESNSIILFDSYIEDVITLDIEKAISNLDCSNNSLINFKKNTTTRDMETAISWIKWYIGLQVDIFDERFGIYNNKKFSIAYLRSIDEAQIDVIFKLHTINVSGCTMYRISIFRLGVDRFVCLEH